ncbi:hypothetical protein AB9R16_05215 [Neisseria gonorrhoeae]|uniref:hypothetical protein n=1 Tax=Neisseria gonorrhoeae TaxID=485 RepID=UPI001FD6BDE3|nr:hypothetical protein [Neisseria gonorrhoeae]
MPSERTNSLQTAFCRQTDLLKPTFFIISDKLLCKNPKIQNHRKLSKKTETIRRRSRESGNPDPETAEIYRKNRNSKTTDRIPACAGMTAHTSPKKN